MKSINLKKFLIVQLHFIFISFSFSQPIVEWQKTFGGSGTDNAFSTSKTQDGGYIMLGTTNSADGVVQGSHGGFDFWLVKTSAQGTLEWQKCYGGTSNEKGYHVIQTSDGGYILVGSSNAVNGDVTKNQGLIDLWVLKVDQIGGIEWQQSFGGSGQDWGKTVLETNTGDFLIYGITSSTNGDVIGNHGGSDEWLLKLNSSGVLLWQKCYGGSGMDGISAYDLGRRELITTLDGGFLIAGASTSNDGDVSGHHTGVGNIAGDFDFWITKIDFDGAILWQRSLGGTNYDRAFSCLQDKDGNYVISGQSMSTDGDVTGHVQAQGATSSSTNSWVVKLDQTGQLIWQKIVGFGLGDCISETVDGGYVLGKFTSIVKIDTHGNLLWQEKVLNSKTVTTIFETSDGGFIASAYSQLTSNDFTLIKFSPIPSYIIRGTLFEDKNGNCQKDGNEKALSGRVVQATPGNYYASTDDNGDYVFYVDSGTYTITHAAPNYYHQVCPSPNQSLSATVNAANPTALNNNFADSLATPCVDLKHTVGTWVFRQCFKNNIHIAYSNSGSITAKNVAITLNFDEYIIPLSSSIPWVKNGTAYTFTLDSLTAGQNGSFFITDSVSCSVPSGILHNACINSLISSSDLECDNSNNQANYCHYIVGSCDPNAIELSKNEAVFSKEYEGTFTDTLTYQILFQNTGTYEASTVIIRDTLPAGIDIMSFQSGVSSHSYTFRFCGKGVAEWTFNNIALPDSTTNEPASHGFVQFKVLQNNNDFLAPILNSANIIFDYNEPILTDTAIFNYKQQTAQLTQMEQEKSTMISIYPNPSTGNLKFNLPTDVSQVEVEIFNLTGESVHKQYNILDKTMLNLNNLKNGIYLVNITGNETTEVHKISILR